MTLRRTIAGLFGVAMLLAACGDDSSTSSATDAPESTSAPAATEAPAATVAPAATEAPATTGASAEGGAVTVDQCTGETRDRTITYDAIPEKIFTVDPQSSEFLIALGLGDRIVGTWFSYSDDELAEFPEYAEELQQIEVMGEGDVWPPTAEVIAASGADMVVTIYRLNIEGYLDSDRLKDDLDIDTYGFVAQCPGGVTSTLEPLYEDIRNLGTIFDVSDKADEIVADMQSTVDEATALTEGREPISIWQYAGEEIPYPAGGWGIPNSVITLAGGKNVFEDVEVNYAEVSWEQVIERNPAVIWMQTDAGPGFIAAEDGIKKAIETNPGLADVDAVANERYVTVSYNAAGTLSIHAADATLDFATQLAKFDIG